MTLDVSLDALRTWRADPARMAWDLFQFTPDAWQRRVLDRWGSAEPRKRIAMQACAGPGKSAVEALCGWHALLTTGDGVHHPNGAAVSITRDNLRANLWKELAVWRERSPLLLRAFELTAERIFAREAPQTWFLDARSFAKTADADALGRTLSGLHAQSIFYLIDESGDIPPAVLRSAEQGLSNCAWGRMIQGGNPTSRTGALYHAATVQARLWDVVRITGDPDDPERSSRIDLAWAREQVALYGRANPWVQAYILGEFPVGALNALLSPDEVRDAMERHLSEDAYSWAQKRLGIDCARFGDDRTVLFPRQGLVAFEPVVLRHNRGHEVAARAMLAKQRWGWELALLDSTGGWGQSTEDALIVAGEAPIGIQFGAPALDPRYKNRRAECWWGMAEWVKRGGALPNDPELVPELTEPTYTLKDGKLLIEPKELLKKRLGRSPDKADALAVTFALPDMPAAMPAEMAALVGAGSGARGVPAGAGYHSDYDPYAEERG